MFGGGRWIRWLALRGKAIRRKPVCELVFPTGRRPVGFRWVRIRLSAIKKTPPNGDAFLPWWGRVVHIRTKHIFNFVQGHGFRMIPEIVGEHNFIIIHRVQTKSISVGYFPKSDQSRCGATCWTFKVCLFPKVKDKSPLLFRRLPGLPEGHADQSD